MSLLSQEFQVFCDGMKISLGWRIIADVFFMKKGMLQKRNTREYTVVFRAFMRRSFEGRLTCLEWSAIVHDRRAT